MKTLIASLLIFAANPASANWIIDTQYELTGAAADSLYASLTGEAVAQYLSIDQTHVKLLQSHNAKGHAVDVSCVQETHFCSFKETHEERNEW